MIAVKGLQKDFKYKKKELGIKNSFKSLIHPKFEEKSAVDNVTFTIEKGECVGFIGPNGAGKTTTLKMLSGIMYPTKGEASILGFTPWERKNDYKRQISIVLGQKNQLWWDLPANESFYLNKCIYGIEDKVYEKTLTELCELLDIKELLQIQVRNLSLGERMKMELIAALLHKPKVIFLDEPTIGLDMIAQKNIREFLKYYNTQEKLTIMLTSHYLEDIEDLCGRSIVINHGKIVYDGVLSAMNEKLQQKKLVKIEIKGKKQLRDTDIWMIRKREDVLYTLEIFKCDMEQVTEQLFKEYHVKDFSIVDIPLEESLSILYQ